MATGFFTELERVSCEACGSVVETWTDDESMQHQSHLGECLPLEGKTAWKAPEPVKKAGAPTPAATA